MIRLRVACDSLKRSATNRLLPVLRTAVLWLAAVAWTPVTAAEPPRPKLLVLVVIDQMRADYLDQYRSTLSKGFRQITTDGAVYTEAFFPYASTETAQGHATMLSGQPPSVSGIVRDSWYDRDARTVAVAGASSRYALLDGAARGGSPEQLLVETLGDAMKKRDPRTIVLSASWKRYAAVMLGGKRADAAYWFDAPSGNITTSRYYQDRLPGWVDGFNARNLTGQYAGRTWMGHLLDTSASSAEGFRDALRPTPFPNEVLLEFVSTLLARTDIGRDNVPDLLAVSFSALDYVGHRYGPHTREFDETLRATDDQLSQLLRLLDERIGRGAWTLALVADHGAAPLPEKARAEGEDAGRIAGRQFTDAVIAEVSRTFPDARRLIAAVATPEFYLDYDEAERRGIGRAALERAVADAAQKQPGIARAYTRSEILAEESSADPLLHAVGAGFHPKRSGDVYVLVKPHYIFWTGTGTTHGTPYEYDQHVPLVFYGKGIVPGVHRDRVSIIDLAPTLSAIAGVRLEGVPGQVLAAALSSQALAQP